MKRRDFLRKGLFLGAAGFLPKVELPASDLPGAAALPELIRLEKLLTQKFITNRRRVNIIERGVSDPGTQGSWVVENIVFRRQDERLQKTLAPYRDVPLEQWGWKNAEERRQTEAVLDRCAALRKRIEVDHKILHEYYVRKIVEAYIKSGRTWFIEDADC